MTSSRVRRLHLVGAAVLVVALAAALAAPAAGEPRRLDDGSWELDILSPVFTIDRKYRSMEGPFHGQMVALLETKEPELLWITSYRVQVVSGDGASSVSQEFMCHNNLNLLDVAAHQELFGEKPISNRLFTLSQGQFSIELPAGFGVPILSSERLSLMTQVLNHNQARPGNLEVRHRITIRFHRDRELTRPMRPLFMMAPFVMTLLEGKDGYFGLREGAGSEAAQGDGCLPGTHAAHASRTGVFSDDFGRTFSGHWVVKPGRQTNSSYVTKLMEVPFDTTLHYVAVHVHPFCESLELRDLTTGETLFKSRITNRPSGVGVDAVEVFSSTEGVPIRKGHEYEMVSVYDNPTGADQDAMATFFLYVEDRAFVKPALAGAPAAPSPRSPAGQGVVDASM
jgi:hypothetical protein